MAALASTSFEFNMVVTEVTEDNTSDISEEIDELAGDLEPTTGVDTMKNDIPNNDKLIPYNDDNSTNNETEKKGREDDIYEIEKIVDHRTYRGSIQYMIKWKGYSDKHNSWVSKEHESEYWNNKEIEAKEKIKSLADRHNINTKKLKRQKSNRIKKSQDKHTRQKKSFVELKSSKSNDNLLNNNAGSWEPFVTDVATIQQDPYTGTLIVFLNWKNGHRTSHTNKVTNVKCPQKMLEFYQRHVQFVHQQH
ncbi:9398_t:CDS:2 [Funneliformis caledonium]|uniref:9398_t:CDS:1 n=1 Tax=Funneliformis caledonium TaxID=1117310 RepID=A0A9N9DUK4_9GLOM|nr:9398_t:CDS:2 [Funneliformis caledonium]